MLFLPHELLHEASREDFVEQESMEDNLSNFVANFTHSVPLRRTLHHGQGVQRLGNRCHFVQNVDLSDHATLKYAHRDSLRNLGWLHIVAHLVARRS